MAKINKLVMHGFKSFAKRTELVFGENFNCILGPNGSGKSNILDALCFVLGKSSAKALRTEKSANLIYNGGKSKRALKDAEVSIYLSNENNEFPTEDKEVKVTRMIKDNGMSIYKINDEKRTRQQIVELLSLARLDSDGYNIILQGDIVHFCEMQSVERRLLIEEISGISLYEEKKTKAISELDKVGEKLKEADIILNERKVKLDDLEKEREQALKFKDLTHKVKTHRATLLDLQVKDKDEGIAKIDEKVSRFREAITKKQQQLADLKALIHQKKEEISKINKEIEQKGEKDQVDLHKTLENLKVSFATSKTSVEGFNNELSKIRDRKKQLLENIKEIEKKVETEKGSLSEITHRIKDRTRQIEELDDKIKKFKDKNNLDQATDFEKEIDSLDKSAESLQDEVQKIISSQQDMLREKDRLEIQIQGIDEKITKVLSLEKENADQLKALKQYKEEFKKATLELTKLLNEDQASANQLANARRNTQGYAEELSKLEAKSTHMNALLAQDTAVSAILKQRNKIKGILGTVSELGKVSSQYALAMEIAAGGKIKHIVVENDKVASECISYLKENKLGVATFLPLNKIKGREKEPELQKILNSNGVHGLAIGLMSYDARYNNIFSYVFGSTIVVDNIDAARRIGIGSAKMVTVDGDLVEKSGAMHGGYAKSKSKGIGFSEKELSKSISDYEEKIADLRSVVSRLEDKQRSDEEKIRKLRELKANLEGEIIKLEKSLHIDSEDVNVNKKLKQEIQERQKKLEKDLEEIQNQVIEKNVVLAQNKIKRQNLRQQINQLRSPTLVAELNAFSSKRTEFREEVIKLETEQKNLEEKIKNVLDAELSTINKVVKQNEKEEDEFKEKIKSWQEKIDSIALEIKEKEAALKKFQEQFKDLFSQRDKLEEDIDKNDKKVDELILSEKEEDQKVTAVSLDLARLRAERDALLHEFEEFKGVELVKDKSIEHLKKDIGISEGVITRMGDINMKAIEVYDHVYAEYDSLLKKKDKLRVEKEDVLLMINEIDLKKTDLFMGAFDVVNNHFKSIFLTLSTKGEASLVLENEKAPFEGGVLIKVKLSGNKFLDIRSLSGGEKTMTALAFIFAIEEHDPAPFYILDEVDAALDKKNSEKLSELVKKYSDRAQYLIISHNDGVISQADTLYGVSMDEFGISNVTSLRL